MMEDVLIFAEIAGGIILGFMIWSYVGPSLSGATSITPSA